VAQGWEARGHVRGTTSTLALVPAAVDAVAPVPVVAAGGIADGRGLAAVLALGAEAAWIGTRFLGATEADLHPLYRARVLGKRHLLLPALRRRLARCPRAGARQHHGGRLASRRPPGARRTARRR
jgi:nitronate monooxygenase/enoyl-[acyl-carrier protein] reductase II